MLEINKIHCGNTLELLKQLPDDSVDLQLCSPPYFNMRSYLPENHPNKDLEFGCEKTPEEYVEKLANIFDEVRRVLKNSGCCFVNLADTFLGSGKGIWYGRTDANKESFQFQTKPKEIMGGWRKKKQLAQIPARFAIEMQNRGWWLRNKLIWYKKNALPQSCKDRFVIDYEEILFFTKSYKYNFNLPIEPFANSSNPNEIYTGKATKNYEAAGAQNPSDTKRRILERMKQRGGRSMRSVWAINTARAKGNHTASWPEPLAERMIVSGSKSGDTILDIFSGTGTSCAVGKRLGRNYLGFDLSEEYCEIAKNRIQEVLL